MEEDFKCPKFNSYGNHSISQYDDSGLYVKNIPSSLTYEAFLALMSEGGRKVKRSKLFPPRMNSEFTAGIVDYEYSKDAQEVMANLNGKPPLNLCIDFKKKDSKSLSLNFIPQNSRAPVSSSSPTPALLPTPSGKGRGALINSVKFPALKSLKVTLEGEKRIAIHTSKNVPEKNTNMFESSGVSDIPKLVINPFLSCLICGNVGQFSCDICKKPYCCSKCQLADWPNHKITCHPFEQKLKETVHKCSRDSSYVSESSSSESDKKSPISPPKRFSSIKNIKPSEKPQIVEKIIKAKDIQSSVLPSNKHVKVKVCHIANPSSFWVHLQTADSILSQMERDIALSNRIASTCEVDNICCTVLNGKFKRARIKKVNVNQTSLIEFVDYGSSSTVSNEKLFCLPESFKEVPYQAIHCKLVDTGEVENPSWSEDDIVCFKMHASENMCYTAHVVKSTNNIYEVNLINEEGISLYSVILGLKNLTAIDLKESSESTKSEKISVPSVWQNLKNGAEVSVIGVEFAEDRFWGILNDGSGVDKHVAELDTILQNLKTKEVNMYVEEGEIVAGFSTQYQQNFRCIVLKRLRGSFLVQYIDYGNKEEISKLYELTPEILKKCSYIVCCLKPSSMDIDEFKTFFSQQVSVSVIKPDNSMVKLSISHKNCVISLNCYPWYYGIDCIKSEDTVQKSSSLLKFTAPPDAVVSPKLKPVADTTNCSSAERILSDRIKNLELKVKTKYDIKVVFFSNNYSLFIQLKADEKRLSKLREDLNLYCSSLKCSKYNPIKNEIVCCKFKDDGFWYRAEVLSRRGNRYKVFFIDFGNDEIVSEEDMKPLAEKYSSPRFCVGVTLDNVKENDIWKETLLKKLNEHEYWVLEVVNHSSSPIQVLLSQDNRSIIDLVKNSVSFKKSSLVFQKLPLGESKVVMCHADKEKLYVHQFKDMEAIGNLINKINSTIDKMSPIQEVIVDSVYFALFTDGLWYRALVNEVLSSDTCLVAFLDFGNQLEMQLKNMRMITEEFFNFPVYSIPVIPENVKIAEFQLQTEYPVEVTGEQSGAQLIKVMNVQKKILPNISDFKKVVLSERANDVILCYFEKDFYYFLLTVDLQTCTNLSEKLICLSKEKPSRDILLVGTVVSAKAEDGVWYRGAIEKVCDNGSFTIKFIDFGNSENVVIENIMCLPEETVKYPVFSIPVKIKNSEKAKKYLIEGKPMVLKKIGISDDETQIAEVVLPESCNLPSIFSFKKEVLSSDKVSDITLCHVEGDVYYCQKISDQDQIKLLESKLQEAAKYEALSSLPEVGSVICSKFVDNVFYRGSVEEICPNTNSCKICFIDYGNIEEVKLENMRILPEELCLMPVYSIPIQFKNIETFQEQVQAGVVSFPVQVLSISSEDVQLVEVVEPKLKKSVTSMKSRLLPDLPVEITVCFQENEVFYVQRISDENDLTEMLINLQDPKPVTHNPNEGEVLCAKFDGVWYRGTIKKNCGGNVFEVFFVDFGNTDKINKSDIGYLPTQYASLPKFSIPIKLHNTCSIKTLSLNSKYTVKRIDNTQDIQIVLVRPVYNPVLISALKPSVLEDNVTSICVQSFEENFHYVIKNSDIENMSEMNNLLNKFEGEEIFESPDVGEVFIVKTNNKWYRGSIKHVNKVPGHCSIFLFDQGSTEVIPFSSIFYINEKFVEYPMFCIKVLFDLSSVSAKPPSIGENLDVTIAKMGNVPTISIYPKYMFNSLKRNHLPVGIPKKVVFFHEEGDIMFLQDVESQLRLAELMSEVQTQSASISHRPIVGELLIAQSNFDNLWYRSCVEEILSTDKLKINFIDYGNSEIVSKDKLCCFSEKFMEYSPFCIPVKITNSSAQILLEQVYSIVADNQPAGNNPQIVHLASESNSDKTPESSNMVSQSQENISATVQKTSSEPTKKYIYDDYEQEPIEPGSQDIIIYAIVDRCYAFCGPCKEENLSANAKLIVDITKYCQSLPVTSYNASEAPQVEEMVLAKFEGDWYRATILSVEGNSFDVLFVDYGNTETITIEDMRKMEDEFMSLDIQARLCLLTGFQYEETHLSEIAEELKKFVNTALKGNVSIVENEIQICIPDIIDHLKKKNLATS